MGPTLRASCDSCNQAKVKCTKNTPQCARCKKNRIDCVYGISLRAGKRAAQVSLPKDIETPSPTPTNLNRESSASTNPYSPLEMDICPPTFQYDESFPLEGYQSNGYFSNDNTFQPLPDLSIFDTQSVYQASTATNASTNNRSPALLNSVPSLPTAITHPGLTQTTSITLSSSCSCFRSTILTLSTLQELSESSHMTFDVALIHNKEAVALCLSTLRCSCASNSTMVLLVASLLVKIINIYKRPCGTWKAVEQGRASDSSKPVTARLTLGAYNFDEGDEERLKTEIAKIELRKVETVISKLKESFGQTNSESEQRVYESLVAFLSDKMRSAFK